MPVIGCWGGTSKVVVLKYFVVHQSTTPLLLIFCSYFFTCTAFSTKIKAPHNSNWLSEVPQHCSHWGEWQRSEATRWQTSGATRTASTSNTCVKKVATLVTEFLKEKIEVKAMLGGLETRRNKASELQAGLSAVVQLLEESPMSEFKQVLAYAFVMLFIRRCVF